MIRRASSLVCLSKRRSNLSVLAGVISAREKRSYRCDDFPNDGDQLADKLGLKGIKKSLEGIERTDRLFHGVRSW